MNGFYLVFHPANNKKEEGGGGGEGGKEEEKRREKREGRVKGELPQVITTANQSGKGCWDLSVF